MDILGLDRKDDSLSGTPHRVAKMYVQEIFRGLNPANRPVCRSFDNVYQYSEMLVERNITVNSTCEHHFLPIVGRAHVAYFSSGRVVGLSKLNRVVDHFGRRPQVGGQRQAERERRKTGVTAQPSPKNGEVMRK